MKYVHSLVVFSTVLLPSLLAAQTSVIENGDFDTGIEGWIYQGPAAGSMEWDPNQGMPAPGSLRLTAPPGVRGSYTARSRCLLTPRGSVWDLRANGLAANLPLSHSCTIGILWFEQADCSDEAASILQPPLANRGMWGEARLRLSQHSNNQAVQGILALQTQGGGQCHFDNVRFEATNAGVFLVPAASPTTLLVLGVAIGLAGILLLRLQRS